MHNINPKLTAVSTKLDCKCGDSALLTKPQALIRTITGGSADHSRIRGFSLQTCMTDKTPFMFTARQDPAGEG
ncbi:hypothetical protein BDW67DRAFT_160501 [Aspergillus spinulosporus]